MSNKEIQEMIKESEKIVEEAHERAKRAYNKLRMLV